MKKELLLIALVFTYGIIFNASAQTASSGEKIFIEQADECLAIIEQAAQKMSVSGVAVIAFIPGDVTKSWISKMKVAGALTSSTANLLAIANSKASEMADTYKNSGSGVREPKTGEFGWQGGIIKKVNSGYILGAFSGATGEQDVELAGKGLDWLYKHY